MKEIVIDMKRGKKKEIVIEYRGDRNKGSS